MITIRESKMDFGPYDEKNVFEIEKSKIYLSLGQGIKVCEFILLDDKRINFIEAKSSSPKKEANENDFSEFIREISDKLKNSFEIFLSGNLEILPNQQNENIKLIDIQKLKEYKLNFCLVINGHQTDWLTPIKNALDKKLLPQRKIWKTEILVLNDEQAKRYKLIS